MSILKNQLIEKLSPGFTEGINELGEKYFAVQMLPELKKHYPTQLRKDIVSVRMYQTHKACYLDVMIVVNQIKENASSIDNIFEIEDDYISEIDYLIERTSMAFVMSNEEHYFKPTLSVYENAYLFLEEFDDISKLHCTNLFSEEGIKDLFKKIEEEDVLSQNKNESSSSDIQDLNAYTPAKRKVSLTAKEGTKFKYLGDIGETIASELLPEKGFKSVINLNKIYPNFPFADFAAIRNGKKYIISVKARNKYEHTGKLNSRYKLGDTPKLLEKIKTDKKYNDFKDHIPGWLAIPLEEKTYDAYFGLIEDLSNKRGIPMSKKAICGYECLASSRSHNIKYETFKNIYSLKKPKSGGS